MTPTKKLRRWNGHLLLGGKQIHVNAAAYSRADLVRLLQKTGATIGASYIAQYWSECWGTAALRNLPDNERGVWDDKGNVIAENA